MQALEHLDCVIKGIYVTRKTIEELDIAAERGRADRQAEIRRSWGVWISAFWVILTICAAFLSDWSNLGLNEWGDYLAGSFAPLALLWLIVGYFQQADELRINSAAVMAQGRELSLQVAELKAQTKAHMELVAVEREKMTTATFLRQKSIEPRFTVDEDFDAVSGYRITIVNTGGTATNIRVASALDSMGYEIKPSSASAGDRFTISRKSDRSLLMGNVPTRSTKIICEDQQGLHHFFEIQWSTAGGSKIMKIVNE